MPSYQLPVDWLAQFLALRDVSHFVVGASVQYTANQESRDVRLQTSSAKARNAVLNAANNLRLPRHLSKADLLATFDATFRIILPDTLDVSRRPSNDSLPDDDEIDALSLFCERLAQRQAIHRVSDIDLTNAVSQVTRDILVQDDPTGSQYHITAHPGLYVLNCSACHLVGGTQLRSAGLNLPVRCEALENHQATSYMTRSLFRG